MWAVGCHDAGEGVELARPAAGRVDDDIGLDPAAVRLDGLDTGVADIDAQDRRPRQELDLAAREMLEVRPHDGVVMHDRVVVEHGARDRVAAAQDRQPSEGVVGDRSALRTPMR